jgi:hypothetical protein
MANIIITEINTNGFDLFNDSDSFLSLLNDEDFNSIIGGKAESNTCITSALSCAGGCQAPCGCPHK